MNELGNYRRDIDGLRSLAILPVLFFHARLPGFSGGYVGVDIFFVISGFLITGIIAREMDHSTFSILNFYERRARRILPALFAMIIAVLAASAWYFLPDDFEKVPPSALMTLGFLANIWFFTKTGYFSGDAETSPLLHCWSLGVEEQFYIGFPVLLWMIARYAPRQRVPIIAIIALASFSWAVWKQHDHDGFAFYLLPPRAWELFAGSLLAVGAVPQFNHRALRQILAAIGLALISVAVFGYDRHTAFPGLTALLPVSGTALIIHTAPGTAVGRLLSTPLLVGLGLISYSLYLWHWPIIIFTEYVTDSRLAGMASLLVITSAILAAWISWRVIERPFRSPKRFNRRQIFTLSGAGMTLLGLIALGMIQLNGWSARFSPEELHLAAANKDFSPKRASCLAEKAGHDWSRCTLGDISKAPSAMAWGDSHGVELAWALGEEMRSRRESLSQRTTGSCPPVLGFSLPDNPDCPKINQQILNEIIQSPNIRRVYLAAFWAGQDYHQAGTIALFDATIAKLRAAGKSVTIIGPVPPQFFYVPRRLVHLAQAGRLYEAAGESRTSYDKQTEWFTHNYPRWEEQGYIIIDPTRALLTGNNSRIVDGDKPLYFDPHHLTLTGARLVLSANPRR